MDAIRKQMLQNAHFQSRLVNRQLEYITFQLNKAISDLNTNRQCYENFWISIDYFGTADLASTYALVKQQPFDPVNLTHLWIVREYVESVLLPPVTSDWIYSASRDCDDCVVERWQCWEDIGKRLGFALPFANFRGMRDARECVRELWPKVWDAIRASAPTPGGAPAQGGLTRRNHVGGSRVN